MTANPLVDKRSGNASEQVLRRLVSRNEVRNVADMKETRGVKWNGFASPKSASGKEVI